MEKNIREKIKELTLLLLWSTSWQEESFGIKVRRSWKGYNFDILDELKTGGLINGSYRAKSVFLTQKVNSERHRGSKKI